MADLLEIGIADIDYSKELIESLKNDGIIPIKLIGPGWGESGYYSSELLERDMSIFEGAHMYWDHPTKSDKRERPERSLKDLAAVVEGPIRWLSEGPAGPGSYADARVFMPYRESLAELAPYIGVSIQAEGVVGTGEKEGRSGKIVEAITSARSVDFVTKPGAGGQIMKLFESARGLNEDPDPEEDKMGELEEAQGRTRAAETERDEAKATLEEAKTKADEQSKELDELKESHARIAETVLLGEAKVYARTRISEAKLPGDHKLPDVTIDRLVESLAANPPVENGKIDKVKFDEALKEGIKSEVEYLANVTGGGSIRGMGSSDGGGLSESDNEDLDKRLDSAFEGMGLSESARKTAVGGRA